ncbi:MAG: glycosyltransferase family 4 protein [Bacteroidetes bacterium]|nr:glycosyltransferase family 4 protein [Bacteroidota bacterium]
MLKTGSHILLLCSRLDLPGGIERAVVNTAGLFAEKGHRVTLLILDETKDSFYPLHPEVELVQLPLSFGITQEGNVITRKIKLLSDVLKLRRTLKAMIPDLIIASEYPFAAAAILAGSNKFAKVVSWEHHHYYELKRNLFWNKIFRLTYPRLHGVVCLNKDEQRLFATINNHPVVIPNFIRPEIGQRNSNKIILTVARLTAVKGIAHLLITANEVLKARPDWQWKIIGDGDLREELLNFIEKNKLTSRLIVQSPSSHAISNEYQQAAIYVMTSVNECFPMTLLEAQMAGLPCVAFDCESGPRHIIASGTGLLIPKEDTVSMSQAILNLIDNDSLRQEMGAAARENVKQFAPDKIYSLWHEQVFTL